MGIITDALQLASFDCTMPQDCYTLLKHMRENKVKLCPSVCRARQQRQMHLPHDAQAQTSLS